MIGQPFYPSVVTYPCLGDRCSIWQPVFNSLPSFVTAGAQYFFENPGGATPAHIHLFANLVGKSRRGKDTSASGYAVNI